MKLKTSTNIKHRIRFQNIRRKSNIRNSLDGAIFSISKKKICLNRYKKIIHPKLKIRSKFITNFNK